MKRVVSLFGSLFLVVVVLQLTGSTAASAAPVSTITLPAGTWDVTTTVVSKDAADDLAYGMTSPTNSQVCPTGEATSCVGGESATFESLSGELVFYMTDATCEQTFQSTNGNHARIDQADPIHWTISWDDAGSPCGSPDGDFNDLITSVVASGGVVSGGVDFATGFYDGVNTLDIQTAFGSKDSMRSEIIVPPACPPTPDCTPYQASQVTDQEISAKNPLYVKFCGGTMCDAQVDVSSLPTGSQPDSPIQVILYFKDDAINGDAVYAQGDSQTSSHLLAKCDSPTVARVGGDAAKCVASITIIKVGKDRVKRVVVNVDSSSDPTITKK